VLKVGHHGSARSSTAPFVAAVGARLAVLSAGPGNPFGHPAGSTIARLSGGGIRILRTDRDGGVALRWRARGPLEIDLPGSPRSLALRR
jgi:competence protein ComEC